MRRLSVSFCAAILCVSAHAAPLTPPPAAVTAGYFGLNVESPDAAEKIPPAASWRLWDAGVGWRDIEPQPGQWDFSRLDAFVNRAGQSGVQILYVFGMTPQWAAANPNDPGNYNTPGMASPPQNMTDWQDYVRTLAQRYKGRIRQWEIWNEANDPGYYDGDQATLLQMAATAYSILKAVDPRNIVLSPSVSPAGGADLAWLDSYLSSGGGRYADVINYHLYEFSGQPEDMADLATRVEGVMARNGQQGKPLWNTESGWLIDSAQHALDSLNGVGPVLSAQQAADYVARSYVVNWATGVSRFYWYAWDDNNFGLLETDGSTVKPAGQAYQRVQAWLTGARMTGCSTGTVWTCNLVSAKGRAAMVAWAPGGTGSLQLPAAWPAAVLNRLDGSQELLSGGAAVTLDGSPAFLVGPVASQSLVPGPSAPDRTPPVLSLLAPAPGARVGVSQWIRVRTSDNVGVTAVSYFVDGRRAATHAGRQLSRDQWWWTGIRPGTHRVQVRARDAAGNWRSIGFEVLR